MVNWFKGLLLKLFELPMPPADERDLALAQKLRDELSTIEARGCSSRENVTDTWLEFSSELRRHADAGDPREFLQWPVVRKSMFVSNPRYVAEELRWLRRLPDWESRWKPALRESPIGRPRPYPRYPRSSGNLIHHAYSLARFETFGDIRVDALGMVYEFGGGYGSMARLFRQLGFAGQYLIQDLPAFSAMQRFYLGSLGYLSAESNTMECVSDFESVDEKLGSWRDAAPKLFLATWSLSESPVVVRELVPERLSAFDFLLIAFQHRFEDLDNLEYFNSWGDALAGQFDVKIEELRHLPGNSYFFASKKQPEDSCSG